MRPCVRPEFGVRSITFERLHRFNSNLVCWYIISKHRSSLILVTIHQFLTELWAFCKNKVNAFSRGHPCPMDTFLVLQQNTHTYYISCFPAFLRYAIWCYVCCFIITYIPGKRLIRNIEMKKFICKYFFPLIPICFLPHCLLIAWNFKTPLLLRQ